MSAIHRRLGRASLAVALVALALASLPAAGLAAGTTVRITDDGFEPATLRVAPGTSNGRTFRVRGEGVRKKDGSRGDLLVTLQVAVPSKLDGKAARALEEYAKATADQDPRRELNEMLGR